MEPEPDHAGVGMSDIETPPTNHKPIAVAVRGARLDYGGRALFDGLDLDLEAGHWTCLLGPSGVGKSSLLRLLAGLLDGADGTASSPVVRCDDGRPLAGRIAYMAQSDLLLPWLPALGNVMLGARLRGERDRAGHLERRARALLDQVGLGGREGDRPAKLSGGQRQRVALARNLMEDRPVVLMDEPFSALDAITRYRLQAQAAELLAGRTVLLVTHDPLEALRLGHRILVMSGQPATLGAGIEPVGEPPRDPASPEVIAAHADLLGRLTAADALATGEAS